jgi:hypothetical protein
VEGETVKGGGALAHPTPVDAGAVSTMTAAAATIRVDENRCGWRRDISHATRVRRCCGVKAALSFWLSRWEGMTMPRQPGGAAWWTSRGDRLTEVHKMPRAELCRTTVATRSATRRTRRARRMNAALPIARRRQLKVPADPRSGPTGQSGRVGEPGGRRDGRGAVGAGEQDTEVPRIAGGARR